jgi:hypothetical protein
MMTQGERMTQTLGYARPLGARRRDRVGGLLVLTYSAGWVGGASVVATFAAGMVLNPGTGASLVVGPAVGSVAGLLLARVLRTRRWAHYLTLVVGLAGAGACAVGMYNLFIEPRGWFWELAMAIVAVALAGGLSLIVAALTGLWMMARPQYIVTEQPRAER